MQELKKLIDIVESESSLLMLFEGIIKIGDYDLFMYALKKEKFQNILSKDPSDVLKNCYKKTHLSL